MIEREHSYPLASPLSTQSQVVGISERIKTIGVLNREADLHTLSVAALQSTVQTQQRIKTQSLDRRNDGIDDVHKDLSAVINSGVLPNADIAELYLDFNRILPNALPVQEADRLLNLVEVLQPDTPVAIFASPLQVRRDHKRGHAGVLQQDPLLTLWRGNYPADMQRRYLSMDLPFTHDEVAHTDMLDFHRIAVGDEIPEQYAHHIDEYIALAHKYIADEETNGQLLLPILNPTAHEALTAAASITSEIFKNLPDIASHPQIQERSRQLRSEIHALTTV